jgi:hypothetical protein
MSAMPARENVVPILANLAEDAGLGTDEGPAARPPRHAGSDGDGEHRKRLPTIAFVGMLIIIAGLILIAAGALYARE